MTWSPAGLALHRWQFTLVIFMLLAALGAAALLTISKTEDPTLDPPTYIVNAVLPGATPQEVEQLVSKPIERAVYKLDSVREVRSQSRDGISSTRVEFVWGSNPETAFEQVSREVTALRPTLPTGLVRLDVVRARPLGVAIVQVALASDLLPMRRLEKIADKLTDKLGAIPGIAEAEYWGVTPSEMRVSLDPVKMAALEVGPSQVTDAVRAAGAESPVGSVDVAGRRFDVQHEGAYRDARAIAQLPVRSVDGAVLRVQDVAQVGWAENEPDHITRFNGRRAVIVTVTQSKNEDVTRLARAVDSAIDEFERGLPFVISEQRSRVQANADPVDLLRPTLIRAAQLVLELQLRAGQAISVFETIPIEQERQPQRLFVGAGRKLSRGGSAENLDWLSWNPQDPVVLSGTAEAE